VLIVNGLSKAYGEIRALDGCSFEVTPGKLVGFLGPNGAGKTTCMRAIFGLVEPDAGMVTWQQRPIGPAERLRFGYMPESRGLYPKMKAADQLTYLATLHGMDRSSAHAAALGWLDRLGLAERAGDPVEKLSHGNQQRVQLAAALVHAPELLVLDEPFSGLDPLGVETMAEVLRERAREGAAVLFSSHQLDLVEDLCEEVVIINRGAIVKSGEVDAIKDAAPVRHLELELADGAAGLLDDLPGVVRSHITGNRHRLVISAEVDVRKVLVEALARGQVRRFVYTTPSLSEIFLEVVA
jgi:ABC-2 type transport system ATP-binding protein